MLWKRRGQIQAMFKRLSCKLVQHQFALVCIVFHLVSITVCSLLTSLTVHECIMLRPGAMQKAFGMTWIDLSKWRKSD